MIIRNIVKCCIPKLFLFTVSLLLLCGCKKDNPPTGEYWIYIRYSTGLEESGPVTIRESSRDKLVIDNSEFRKEGKIIKGTFYGLPFSPSLFKIEGECSHSLFSNNYSIKGTFEETAYYKMGPHNHFYGTFTIVTEP